MFERLEKAFACPTTDPETGLAQTTEADRAVGFGFCDAETHTGKLLFASLLRYRAAGELAELAKALGHRERVAGYRQIQKTIRANLARTFGDPASRDGWLRASTGLSGQPDVWGTLFALHLGVLDRAQAAAARKTVADAVQERHHHARRRRAPRAHGPGLQQDDRLGTLHVRHQHLPKRRLLAHRLRVAHRGALETRPPAGVAGLRAR